MVVHQGPLVIEQGRWTVDLAVAGRFGRMGRGCPAGLGFVGWGRRGLVVTCVLVGFVRCFGICGEVAIGLIVVVVSGVGLLWGLAEVLASRLLVLGSSLAWYGGALVPGLCRMHGAACAFVGIEKFAEWIDRRLVSGGDFRCWLGGGVFVGAGHWWRGGNLPQPCFVVDACRYCGCFHYETGSDWWNRRLNPAVRDLGGPAYGGGFVRPSLMWWWSVCHWGGLVVWCG